MSERSRAGTGAIARMAFAAALALTLACALRHPADARPCRHRGITHRGRRGLDALAPTDPDKDAALIVDGATGKVLYARNETQQRHPASLTKMMTLYLLFEQLKSGTDDPGDRRCPFPSTPPIQHRTKLHLRPGRPFRSIPPSAPSWSAPPMTWRW